LFFPSKTKNRIFICVLFDPSEKNSDLRHGKLGSLMNNLETISSRPGLRHYPDSCLETLRKTTIKNILFLHPVALVNSLICIGCFAVIVRHCNATLPLFYKCHFYNMFRPYIVTLMSLLHCTAFFFTWK
jgi:hypothetical protein